MPLPTKHCSILIVEDDKHKLDSVRNLLLKIFDVTADITVCEAMSSASKALAAQEFDVVIIDMSIPSHPKSAGAGSPFSFPSGGLDVIFEIDELRHKSICIVLTQYPEIEIEGVLVPVDMATAEVYAKFSIRIADCIQYSEDSSEWKQKINDILGEP